MFLQVCCAKCGNGLGHEFLHDGPREGLSRFWIYSSSLTFIHKSESVSLLFCDIHLHRCWLSVGVWLCYCLVSPTDRQKSEWKGDNGSSCWRCGQWMKRSGTKPDGSPRHWWTVAMLDSKRKSSLFFSKKNWDWENSTTVTVVCVECFRIKRSVKVNTTALSPEDHTNTRSASLISRSLSRAHLFWVLVSRLGQNWVSESSVTCVDSFLM